jgi:aspartyl protease family protein
MATGFMAVRRLLDTPYLIAAFLAMACAPLAQATDVALAGLVPGGALIVVDGGRPRTIIVGAKTPEGVKLLSVEDGGATFEVDGRRQRLVIGQRAVSTGAGMKEDPTVSLMADARGQFITQGSINGTPMRFLVDTGATNVSLSVADAARAGIDYLSKGQPGAVSTANGVARAWRVPGVTVRLGDISFYDVDVTVTEAPMPFALLGMSFLNRLEMRRNGDTMTLKKRF